MRRARDGRRYRAEDVAVPLGHGRKVGRAQQLELQLVAKASGGHHQPAALPQRDDFIQVM